MRIHHLANEVLFDYIIPRRWEVFSETDRERQQDDKLGLYVHTGTEKIELSIRVKQPVNTSPVCAWTAKLKQPIPTVSCFIHKFHIL